MALVQRAEREQTTVRAVGSGHSWSDVALTDGFLVEPDRLGGMLPLDDGCLRPEARERQLVRVLGGTMVRALNAALDDAGLALPNMGGYDGQTIAGVVSTSTHGSGLRFGPFPDMVRSLDLVVAGGEIVRVEPDAGPTDPEAFERVHGGARRLVKDDRTFAAAVCGMGCMGLIHSMVLEVRDKFWLNEVRTVDSWEAVRDSLTEDGVLGELEHYELLVNPYAASDGAHHLLITVREECPEPAELPQDKLERNPLVELEASFFLTGLLLRLFIWLFPSKVPGQMDQVIDRLKDDGYASVSYRVFNIGEANKLPAYSMELAVPLEGGRHIEAIDRILAIAKERREKERLYHTSPIALRFVAPSEAHASMMHGRATMMIELIMAKGTRGGFELLAGYEERLADLGVRAHWGQYNILTPDRLQGMYPRWEDWLEIEGQFNASGVFDSPFTKRVGI